MEADKKVTVDHDGCSAKEIRRCSSDDDATAETGSAASAGSGGGERVSRRHKPT